MRSNDRDDRAYSSRQEVVRAGDGLYQFIYPATNPKIIGIGFAATRDLASFALRSATDAHGTPNPLAGTIQWAIATGLSRSGRFHRPFLHLGFNQDEHGRQVFDGMMPYINGSAGGFFNHRFGQPNRTALKRLSHVYPEQVFPFAYSRLTDSHSRYVELVRQASERLVAERLILREDAEAFIKLAEERDLGLPR